MKLKALIVAAAVSLSAAMALCSCSDTSSKKAAAPQKVAETVAETTTQGTESLPDTSLPSFPMRLRLISITLPRLLPSFSPIPAERKCTATPVLKE